MLERVSSPSHRNTRLARRRRQRRRLLLGLLCVVVLACIGALLWALWQPAFRITTVTIVGGDPSLAQYALGEMQGTRMGILPGNSTFFVPTTAIRTAILATSPTIAAVAIERKGFSTLSITIDTRTSVARWCGASPDTTLAACYVFDPNGFIFATTPSPLTASTTDTLASSSPAETLEGSDSFLDPFILYEPLASSRSPIGLTLPNANNIPAIFSFAQQLTTFGATISTIAIHDGQVDDLLTSGTRISYLLGQEQSALTALASGRNDLNLSDGSLEYVDLRFSGKIYLKKK